MEPPVERRTIAILSWMSYHDGRIPYSVKLEDQDVESLSVSVSANGAVVTYHDPVTNKSVVVDVSASGQPFKSVSEFTAIYDNYSAYAIDFTATGSTFRCICKHSRAEYTATVSGDSVLLESSTGDRANYSVR